MIEAGEFDRIEIQGHTLTQMLLVFLFPVDKCTVTVVDGMLKVQCEGRIGFTVGPTFWKRTDVVA